MEIDKFVKSSRIELPTEEEIINIHDYLAEAHGTQPGMINSPGYVPYVCDNYIKEGGIVPVIGFLLSRLSKGHYFVDGNKRTAYFTGKYTSLRNGLDFNGTSPEEAAKEMEKISSLDQSSSQRFAEELVKRDLIYAGCRLENYTQFEKFVLKSIAVSNKLSRL